MTFLYIRYEGAEIDHFHALTGMCQIYSFQFTFGLRLTWRGGQKMNSVDLSPISNAKIYILPNKRLGRCDSVKISTYKM